MTRLTRDESKERTRLKLMEAARNVFARLGYGGASVDTISEAAGFSKGAFYSNFESKEAIFLELLERHMDGELATSGGLVADGATAESAIDHIARRYATDPTDLDWCLLSIEFALHATRSPAFAVRHAELFERHYRGIAKIIKSIAALSGRKVTSPISAAAGFVAYRQGLALHRAGLSPRLSQDDVRLALKDWMYAVMGGRT